jgi:hypothetical protein
MHVLAPRPPKPDIPIFFNVDSTVGQGGANSNIEDILLVQFLVRKTAETASPTLSADRKARMLKVPTTGVCDDATIDGIKAAQEHIRQGIPGTVVDGRVSPARGYDYGGGGSWIVVFLNMQMRIRFSSVWPRLQDLDDCPAQLKTKFQAVL